MKRGEVMMKVRIKKERRKVDGVENSWSDRWDELGVFHFVL